MKKLLIMLAVVLLCSAAFALADTAPHTHKWVTEVLERPGCNTPGLSFKECTICGVQTGTSQIAPTGHQWKSDDRRLATCTAPGERIKWCANCGDQEVVPVNALGHDMVSVTHVEATCLRDGKTVKRCKRCQTEETKIVKATGHSYGPWQIQKEPTCTEKGVKIRYCSNCGIYWDEDIEPTGEHRWGSLPLGLGGIGGEGKEESFCLDCGKMSLMKLPVSLPELLIAEVDIETLADHTAAVEGAEYIVGSWGIKGGIDDILVTNLIFSNGDYTDIVPLKTPIELRNEGEKVMMPLYTAKVLPDDIVRGYAEFSIQLEGVRWDKAAGAWGTDTVVSEAAMGEMTMWYGGTAAPILSVTQTAGPTDFVPGAEVTFEWTLWNAGGSYCFFDSIMVDAGPDAMTSADHSIVVTPAMVNKVKMQQNDRLTGTVKLTLPSDAAYTDQAALVWCAAVMLYENDPVNIKMSNPVVLTYEKAEEAAQPYAATMSIWQLAGPTDYVPDAIVLYEWTLVNKLDQKCRLNSLEVQISTDGATILSSKPIVNISKHPGAFLPPTGSLTGSSLVSMPSATECPEQFYFTFVGTVLTDPSDPLSVAEITPVTMHYSLASSD